MRILQIHNRYQSGLGGEDSVVEAERQLLTTYGHEVRQYIVRNSSIKRTTAISAIRIGIESIWSRTHYRIVRDLVETYMPNIVHVHNTFAVLSPSTLWAVKHSGVPCIYTLHNYRITCAASTLFRSGAYCDACVGKFPVPAFLHKCTYNNSFAAGASIAVNQVVHSLLKTYNNTVSAFIVLNDAAKAIMERAGLPPTRIHVKPNTVTDVFSEHQDLRRENNKIVYVGQITQAKGVELLLHSWDKGMPKGSTLALIGDGPDKARLQELYRHNVTVKWLGRLDHKSTLSEVASAHFLVMPSIWHEPFGLVIAEALMLGTPVVLPNHVAMSSIIETNNAGFVYQSGDPSSLENALQQGLLLKNSAWSMLSASARATYQQFFTPQKGYEALMDIYLSACE